MKPEFDCRSRWVKHFYDGGGKKLKTLDSDNVLWEYANGAVYKNGLFYQVAFEEGRLVATASGFMLEFDYKDHLGNLRLSYREADGSPTNGVYSAPVITQENAYYPFGLSHTGTDFSLSLPNQFQYNGKEKVNSFGLNYSDYGFRTLDLLTNRFISVDPLADGYPHNGTFNYAENRPINGVDLDGLEFYMIENKNITTIGVKVRFENNSHADEKRVTEIKNELQQTFTSTISSGNSSYKGELVFDDKATIGFLLTQKLSETRIGGVGGIAATVTNNNVKKGVSTDFSTETVAVKGVHELLHVAGLGHPTDVYKDPKTQKLVSDNPVADTKLNLIDNKDGTYQYSTTQSTSKDIYSNIMLYGDAVINSKKVSDVRGSVENGTKITPGQRNVIEQNIKKGLVNGEAAQQF